jgi:sporulation protein YabP
MFWWNKMNEKSILTLMNRTFLTITGVNKIISLDSTHFSLDTTLGTLKIIGNNLEMQELDSNNKTLNIKGEIENISYKEEKVVKNNFVKKLFK